MTSCLNKGDDQVEQKWADKLEKDVDKLPDSAGEKSRSESFEENDQNARRFRRVFLLALCLVPKSVPIWNNGVNTTNEK